jgi:hypothetical protein
MSLTQVPTHMFDKEFMVITRVATFHIGKIWDSNSINKFSNFEPRIIN